MLVTFIRLPHCRFYWSYTWNREVEIRRIRWTTKITSGQQILQKKSERAANFAGGNGERRNVRDSSLWFGMTGGEYSLISGRGGTKQGSHDFRSFTIGITVAVRPATVQGRGKGEVATVTYFSFHVRLRVMLLYAQSNRGVHCTERLGATVGHLSTDTNILPK